MSVSRIKIVFVILAATVMLASCGGQNADIEGPKKVATAAFESLRNTDWATYSTYLTQDALQNFQAQVVNGLGAIIPRDADGNPSDSFQIMGQMYETRALTMLPADSFMVEILSQLFETTPQLGQTFATIQNEIVGGVKEGETFTHLVIRNEYAFQGEPVQEMSVSTLRLDNGEWKMMLSHQIRGIADMMVQSMQAQANQARMREQLQNQSQGNR
jgi:hypothetical protein